MVSDRAQLHLYLVRKVIEIFFKKHITNIDTYTRMSTHFYEHTHAHHTPMSIFERLSRLDLEIHEVGHQERLAVDGTSPPTEKIISRKYNTHVKSRI
jgi:hypothetical protein